MSLKVSHLAICRTPAFALTDTLEERWEDLKQTINESSPTFFQLIADKTIEQLIYETEKVNFSVWKYFNRSRFRATPYGRFAGVTLVSVNWGFESIRLNRELKPIVFRTWQEKEACFNNHNSELFDGTFVRTNPSIYNVSDELRYIRFINNQFQLEGISATKQLNELITFCEEPKTIIQLSIVLRQQLKLSRNLSKSIIEQLIKLEILLTERTPNIIGDDYFNRVSYNLPFKENPYVNCLRPLLQGGINSQLVKQLPELTAFLAKILPDVENKDLAIFKSAFRKKFEEQIVPLALVMDPELGIGYGQLEQTETERHIIAIFNSTKPQQTLVSKIPFTRLHHFLLKGIIDKTEIKLEEFKCETGNEKLPLPNSLSILTHFWNGNSVIESIGGCTANALIGRFTIADKNIYNLGKEIVDLEEKANPGVMFFDIGYQAEKTIDNVNRRQELYSHEFPILSWSTNQSTISIKDILVFIRNMEVILWSKKHDKRIVPRIASAYNYNRSDLAVYRLLCDIQHQGIKSNLNFKPKDIFPDLDFYPRVCYKKTIVTPAMWKIPQSVINANLKDLKPAIKAWLHQVNLLTPFKVGDTDQTLCFDPLVDADMDALTLYCKQYSNNIIYLTEALIANNEVIDENDRPYAAQFIFNLTHTEQIYNSYESVKQLTLKHDRPMFSPGEEWIYFEIYCHPIRSNELLIKKIRDYIKGINKGLLNWFFIRYDAPQPHIRLRIQIKDISKGYLYISQLNNTFSHEKTTGLVSDIQIKTYFPETIRYGVDRIASVERLFNIDSNYAIVLVTNIQKAEDIYQTTITFILNLLSVCINNIREKRDFSKLMANNFTAEFGFGSESFKSINQYFKQLDFDKEAMPAKLTALSNRYVKLAKTIFSNCNESERSNMLADMIHMHINRLFISDQRRHEAVLYHFLVKVLEIEFNRSIGSKV